MQALHSYVPYGEAVGALPSGRLAGSPLSDAASPCLGDDLNGPTAVINSLKKVNSTEQNFSNILNMRIDPKMFDTDEGFERMVGFVKTAIDEKVQDLQFNVVSAETLRAAQKEPEKYRGLVVKIAGYNAFFTLLNKPLQESIIARSEHAM